ncbi:L-threonylcarbamoyladenylate synthase, partial [Gammaproteobacteria bacterium]|nr:L-threonylcarbamoyladenylate synthase [Gammaproteobacteria bacterium]
INLKNNNKLSEFIESVKNGAIFAYPTEAVFGLGCDVNNRIAIQKILDIKQRGTSKGLIVISDNIEKVRNLINDDHFKLFVQNSGAAVPTTWLCPASKIVLSEVTGGSNKIAIRITRHEASCNLCKLLDSPIISTSANVTGEKPMTNMEEILDYFGNNIDYVINDRIGESTKPSRILDLITKKVLRDGG